MNEQDEADLMVWIEKGSLPHVWCNRLPFLNMLWAEVRVGGHNL